MKLYRRWKMHEKVINREIRRGFVWKRGKWRPKSYRSKRRIINEMR